MEVVMKAIRTLYNGTRFASKLEAQWAVYMDALGVRWEYEPQGYDFEDGDRYVPDFWLPDHETFLEIKPEVDAFGGLDFSTGKRGFDDGFDWSREEREHKLVYARGRRLMHKLVRETGKRGVIAIGGFYNDRFRTYFSARADREYYHYAMAPWSTTWKLDDEEAYQTASQTQFDEWRR
jgi:hypothetical protein